MTSSITRDDLWEIIGALVARMDHVERRIEKIDNNVESLAAAANMGRGAWWGAAKIGGLIVIMLGAGGWIWSQLRLLAERWVH